jgi:hypothetical protein
MRFVLTSSSMRCSWTPRSVEAISQGRRLRNSVLELL